MSINQKINIIQLSNNLKSIANSIRNKTGNTALLEFPNEFNDEIENNIYNIDDWVYPTRPHGEITFTGTTIPAYYAYLKENITKVNAPNATYISTYAFYGNKNLTDVIMSNVVTVWTYAFSGCINLKKFETNSYIDVKDGSFNNCKNLEGIMHVTTGQFGNNVFTNCEKITGLIATANGAWYMNVLDGCKSLNFIDIGNPNTSGNGFLRGNTFRNCSTLNIVIIRSSTVKTLSSLDFANTPFASGGTGGTLYVPQALISDYQEATNWSTILSYENNKILPIEDSIYATQYADGTPLPSQQEGE